MKSCQTFAVVQSFLSYFTSDMERKSVRGLRFFVETTQKPRSPLRSMSMGVDRQLLGTPASSFWSSASSLRYVRDPEANRNVIGKLSLKARYELVGLIQDGPIFATYAAKDKVQGRDLSARVSKGRAIPHTRRNASIALPRLFKNTA